MENKYKEWIVRKGYDTPKNSLMECEGVCKEMQKEFPELSIKAGVISSELNPNNFTEGYLKQYAHYWLTLETGEIVDPTSSQFLLHLGKLVYSEIDTTQEIHKCWVCRGYFNGEACPYCKARGSKS